MKTYRAYLLCLLLAAAAHAGGDEWWPCPEGSNHIKGTGNSDFTQLVEAPPGTAIVQTQVKAGSFPWGYGSGGHQEPVTYKPAQLEVELHSADGKGISHWHACTVPYKPPPPCEEDDPCWCEPDGPGYPCEPPPDPCDSETLWKQTEFRVGWTTDPSSPVGSGCFGDENIVAGETTEACLDVCIDGMTTGSYLSPPGGMPYRDRQCVTVGPIGEFLDGELLVHVQDTPIGHVPRCELTQSYSWAGSVATDTSECAYGDPCWCELHPKDEICGEPPPKCEAWSVLQMAIVPGLDVDYCYRSMTSQNPQHAAGLPPGDIFTVCWQVMGGPDELTLFFNADGVTHRALLDELGRGFYTGPFHGGCGGFASLVAVDESQDCRSNHLINWTISTEAPEVCLPWLP